MFLLILSHCIILYVNPAILLPNNNKRIYMYVTPKMFPFHPPYRPPEQLHTSTEV